MHDASLHAPPTHTALPALMVEQLPVIGKRGGARLALALGDSVVSSQRERNVHSFSSHHLQPRHGYG